MSVSTSAATPAVVGTGTVAVSVDVVPQLNVAEAAHAVAAMEAASSAAALATSVATGAPTQSNAPLADDTSDPEGVMPFIHFRHVQIGRTVRSTCNHCLATVHSRRHGDLPVLKRHLGHCPKLPPDVREALDEKARRDARERVGCYGSNPIYERFDVTGWRVACCKACGVLVRGGARNLHRHVHSRACAPTNMRQTYKPPPKVTWEVVDPKLHFTDVPSEDGKHRAKCNYCVAVVANSHYASVIKHHMGGCPNLPADIRAKLDTAAVCEAKEKMGVYGRNGVYASYDVTGWMVAKCKACKHVVRGASSNLRRHIKGCPGTASAVPQTARRRRARKKKVAVDPRQFFALLPSNGTSPNGKCTKCSAVVVDGHNLDQLRSHLAECPNLNPATRAGLDSDAMELAEHHLGEYSSPVYRRFRVTGLQRAACLACNKEVRGDSLALNAHLSICPRTARVTAAAAGPADAAAVVMSAINAGSGAGSAPGASATVSAVVTGVVAPGDIQTPTTAATAAANAMSEARLKVATAVPSVVPGDESTKRARPLGDEGELDEDSKKRRRR